MSDKSPLPGNKLEVLKEKMRRAKDDADGAREEAKQIKNDLAKERKKREEVGYFPLCPLRRFSVNFSFYAVSWTTSSFILLGTYFFTGEMPSISYIQYIDT